MPTAQPKKRAKRSRPVRRDNCPVISERDRAIFEYLIEHRYGSIDDLLAIHGGYYHWLRERLRDLTSWGYLIRPEAQFKTIVAYRNPLVYQIGPQAIEYLRAKGDFREPLPYSAIEFPHDLIAARVYASFLIGAQLHQARFISWQGMLSSQYMSETIKQTKSHVLHIKYELDGQPHEKDVEPDTKPFGIAIRGPDGKEIHRMTGGVEVDNTTHPWRKLRHKFLADLAIIETRAYRAWGIPNFCRPYVFSNYTHMQNVMDEFSKLTKGNGSRYILFGYFPRFDNVNEAWLKPTGHMLTTPWQRVGHAPFNFLSV